VVVVVGGSVVGVVVGDAVVALVVGSVAAGRNDVGVETPADKAVPSSGLVKKARVATASRTTTPTTTVRMNVRRCLALVPDD
jgi:hypothetical protein